MPDANLNVDANESLVEIRNLTKTYREGERERAVLHDVDATIRRGEFAVLVGPSGSGKSTLLNLISGIDLPTSGEVVVDSTRLTGLSERERTLFRRRNIGFVFQFFNLVPTLTVEENLLLPLELNGKTSRDEKLRASKMLEEIGLADRGNSYPDRLSGGEQQRVAIARALVHDPILVLADEPTGNLDADTGCHVMGLLDRLVRQSGRTIIVVTHSADVICLADRVFAIEEGRLVERSIDVVP